MKRLLRTLVSGESLRHRPVALSPDEQRPVRAEVGSGEAARDAGPVLVPVSLVPLVLGLWSPGENGSGVEPGSRLEVRMRDAASGAAVGDLRLRAERLLDTPRGGIMLLRPTGSRVRCVPALYRHWRHVLAWRQARVNARVPNAFAMSYPDLRALNVFYMMPRPVFLVSVVHGDASNLFPMDLVAPVGADTFLLALRRTSPAIELMRDSGRIVVGSAPAELKTGVYTVGVHHKQKSIDWARLPFAVEPSPAFGIPAPVAAQRVRELEVLQATPVGSHMFFVTRVAADSRRGEGPQLCHVSDMYARWRAAQGRPFVDA